MSAITVLKNNIPTGPFTREQVAQKLQAGEMTLEDLAFVEGLSQWTPLRDVLAKVDAVAVPPPPAPVASPAPAYSYAATMQPPEHVRYAGFWLRVVAYCLDSVFISILMMIVMLIFVTGLSVILGMAGIVMGTHQNPFALSQSQTSNPVSVFFIILVEVIVFGGMLVPVWLYSAKLESGPLQATYGKRLLSLKVTDLSGNRISFGHASGRFFAKIITALIPFWIGYMMAGFTERKQALHDMIAGTLVIRK